MAHTTLQIRTDAPIGVIAPRLYGHFAEHLGRCCYDGIWVGSPRDAIAQQNGFRSDVLAALRALPVPMLRWPGGCYADQKRQSMECQLAGGRRCRRAIERATGIAEWPKIDWLIIWHRGLLT